MWDDDTTTITELKARLADFNKARDWEQFHTPKDLAMCISAEAGELLECFLWKKDEGELNRAAVEEELADLAITVANLSQRLGINLMAAVEQKLSINAERYPVSKARGSHKTHRTLGREPHISPRSHRLSDSNQTAST